MPPITPSTAPPPRAEDSLKHVLATEEEVAEWRSKTLIEAIRDGLREEMERDERVIIFGEDVGPRGGVFGVTDGFHKQFGADRVIDTPLAESVIAGVAIGAALARHAARRRDPVRRLHPPRVRPDRQRGGADPLPLEQRLERARW